MINIKLKISTKIYAIVGVMTLIMLVISYSSYYKLNQISSFVASLYGNSFTGLRYSSNVNILIEQQIGIISGAPAIIDPFALAKSKSDFEGITSVVKATLAEYKAKSPSQETMGRINALETLYGQMLKDSDAIYGFMASSTQDKAIATLETKVKPEVSDIEDILTIMVIKFDVGADNGIKALIGDIKSFTFTMAITLLGVISIAGIVGCMVARQISSRINGLSSVMEQLADGDTSHEVPYLTLTDEIGGMAKTVGVFRQNSIDKVQLEKAAKEAELLAQEEKKKMMQKLASDFESGVQGIITTVASAATELSQTAEGMQLTVANVNKQSATAATASEQASNNVQSVSAAVEEMSASVKEIASQVSKSSTLVNETVTKTKQADQTTRTLSDAVDQISSILQMIQGIAGQINLLALNATIESARAGDAGKGFAVVASEVKNLAGQTTKATEEIATQIENVQNASGEVIGVLKMIQEAIGNISHFSSGIASAVEEQSAATGEISANMQNASSGVQEITNNITNITKGASDADHSAKEVLGAAQMLSKQSELLDQQVKAFIATIRHA